MDPVTTTDSSNPSPPLLLYRSAEHDDVATRTTKNTPKDDTTKNTTTARIATTTQSSPASQAGHKKDAEEEEEEEEEEQKLASSTTQSSTATKIRTTMRYCIPDLLSARQDFGGAYRHRVPGMHASHRITATSTPIVTTNQLSSATAWNVSRMQNMIVCIGPGTPASVCWKIAGGEGLRRRRRTVDEGTGSRRGRLRRTRNRRRRVVLGGTEDSADDDDDDECSESDDEHGAAAAMEDDDEDVDNDHDLDLRWLSGSDLDEDTVGEINEDTGGGEARMKIFDAEATSRPTSEEEQGVGGDQKDPGEDFSMLTGDKGSRTDTCADAANVVGAGSASPGNDGGKPTDGKQGSGSGEKEVKTTSVGGVVRRRLAVLDDDDEEDEEEAGRIIRRRRFHLRQEEEDEEEDEQEPGQQEEDDDEDDDDEEDDDEEEEGSSMEGLPSLLHDGSTLHSMQSPCWHPSIRHGGCINTACWMDCPWRLSTVREAPDGSILSSALTTHHSHECPTQIATSGDDRLLKFWDVSAAMGATSPLPGGWDTFCPLSATHPPLEHHKSLWTSHYKTRYKNHAGSVHSSMAGSVQNIASFNTGHLGNVFHVTPCNSHPGKLLTCAADGFLRLCDVVNDTSTVVVHPYIPDTSRRRRTSRQQIQLSSSRGGTAGESSNDDVQPNEDNNNDDDQDDEEVYVVHTGMAYSHIMVSPNTGLLCSESGLHTFDVRLSPRHQARKSILERAMKHDHTYRTTSCKSVALWSPHVVADASCHNVNIRSDRATPYYVFAGGSSPYVGLYDLRMDGTQCKAVRRYKPTCLGPRGDGTCCTVGRGGGGGTNVSVSGLDISRDNRELLVSYENDQIYSFPICPEAKSAACPTADELRQQRQQHFPFGDEDGNVDKDGDHCMMHRFECEDEEDYDEDHEYDGSNSQRSQFVTPELGSYGGHLNRYTFLKNAKYAGPNDEYICTGSDSGHAFVFERTTGTVAAFLGADSCTCNGVIPHPTLPYFITYGIDSTAKLWRATNPVDRSIDDSPRGRYHASLRRPCHSLSPVTSSWDQIQRRLLLQYQRRPLERQQPATASNAESTQRQQMPLGSRQQLREALSSLSANYSPAAMSLARDAAMNVGGDNDDDDDGQDEAERLPIVLPDFIASQEEIGNTTRFSSSTKPGIFGPESPHIGNALLTLPAVLRTNRYECYSAAYHYFNNRSRGSMVGDLFSMSLRGTRDVPVDQPIHDGFSHRVGIIRLRSQADRLGLRWDPCRQPWNLVDGCWRRHGKGGDDEVDLVDTIPDNPSDWILFDERFHDEDFSPGVLFHPVQNFKCHSYDDICRDDRKEEEDNVIIRQTFPDQQHLFFSSPGDFDSGGHCAAYAPWLVDRENMGSEALDDLGSFWPTIQSLSTDATSAASADEDGGSGDADVGTTTGVSGKTARVRSSICKKLIYQTALALKESGNLAMKRGLLYAAARRYDKAVQYCAIAFMQYGGGGIFTDTPNDILEQLNHGHQFFHFYKRNWPQRDPGEPQPYRFSNQLPATAATIVVWSPLLKVLITSRLNLALLLLKKPAFAGWTVSAKQQASAALKLLEPFAVEAGKVIIHKNKSGSNGNNRHDDDEDDSPPGKPREPKKRRGAASAIVAATFPNDPRHFPEIKSLQAKAYFRLGSAQMELFDFSSAIESYELSMKASIMSTGSSGNDVGSTAEIATASAPTVETGTSTTTTGGRPDQLVIRRLQEAKRKYQAQKKRHRKRFHGLFSGEGAEGEGDKP